MSNQDTPAIWQSERARRLGILLRLLYVCGAVMLVLSALLLTLNRGFSGRITLIIAELGGVLLAIVVAWLLARMGRLEAATHTLFVALVIATVATSLPDGIASRALFAFFIPIVGATVLLRPWWSLGYAAIELAAFQVVFFFDPDPLRRTVGTFILNLVLFGTYFGIVALLSYLAARGYARLLDISLERAAELERARAELEERVAERTRDVRQALEDLQRSAETIRQMSVPVVPVADGVLVLPLVGALDSQRAALLTERLLDAIQRERGRTVLIDITGVPVVDSHVAGVLLEAAQAVRLLGAEPVLVGIRAEVAQTIVGLGLDLSRITTRRDLRSGLAYALSQNSGVTRSPEGNGLGR